MLINVKMPTIVGIIVGIITFISRINFMSSKSFVTSGTGYGTATQFVLDEVIVVEKLT